MGAAAFEQLGLCGASRNAVSHLHAFSQMGSQGNEPPNPVLALIGHSMCFVCACQTLRLQECWCNILMGCACGESVQSTFESVHACLQWWFAMVVLIALCHVLPCVCPAVPGRVVPGGGNGGAGSGSNTSNGSGGHRGASGSSSDMGGGASGGGRTVLSVASGQVGKLRHGGRVPVFLRMTAHGRRKLALADVFQPVCTDQEAELFFHLYRECANSHGRVDFEEMARRWNMAVLHSWRSWQQLGITPLIYFKTDKQLRNFERRLVDGELTVGAARMHAIVNLSGSAAFAQATQASGGAAEALQCAPVAAGGRAPQVCSS